MYFFGMFLSSHTLDMTDGSKSFGKKYIAVVFLVMCSN